MQSAIRPYRWMHASGNIAVVGLYFLLSLSPHIWSHFLTRASHFRIFLSASSQPYRSNSLQISARFTSIKCTLFPLSFQYFHPTLPNLHSFFWVYHLFRWCVTCLNLPPESITNSAFQEVQAGQFNGQKRKEQKDLKD